VGEDVNFDRAPDCVAHDPGSGDVGETAELSLEVTEVAVYRLLFVDQHCGAPIPAGPLEDTDQRAQ
jgi:hypothetical protein